MHFDTHDINHAFLLKFIVVQLQNGLDGNRIGTTGIDYLVNLFGTLLIENKYDYLNRIDLRVAIEADQRVYLVTNEEADDTKHFFRSADVIGENHYKWKSCNKAIKGRRKEMPLNCRGDPTPQCSSSTAMLLMNSFCGRPNHGNKIFWLLRNAERISTSSTFAPSRFPNILMVDFSNIGDVFGAEQCLRDNNVGGNGCET